MTLRRLLSRLGPVFSVLLFALAIWVLDHELKTVHYHDIMAQLQEIPYGSRWLAILFMVLSYFFLTLYDLLGTRYIRHPLPIARTSLAGFVSYAFSNTVGYTLLTGAPLRFRFYTSWGLSAFEVSKLVGFAVLTYWVGLFTVSGATLLTHPAAVSDILGFPVGGVLGIGVLLLLVVGGYLTIGGLRVKPLRIRGEKIPMPPLRLGLAQVAVGCCDWLCAGAVLYALLPADAHITYPAFFAVFVIGQTAGVISHVPGGLGVFETILVHTLSPAIPATNLLATLVLYRVIYYLIPLSAAVLFAGVNEFLVHVERVKWVARKVGQWLPGIVPQILGWATFVGGAVLLFSGATPPVHGRLSWLRDFLPLPVIQFSHFFSSVVGAGLLVLARGIQRRLDISYVLTLALLAAGIVFSLLKGLDYEEATILLVMLLALLPCRRYFYRKSSLTSQRFTPGWLVLVGAILIGSVWLTFFSYRHSGYTTFLWWQFALRPTAQGALRAEVGAMIVLVLFALARLMRTAPGEPARPTPEELETARQIAEKSPSTTAWLALMGDKSLLFNESKTAFLMYQVEGRSWVVLGDPVGPTDEAAELAWQFREMVERNDGWPAFYQVSQDTLPLYIDLGLTFTKLGEEARVPLAEFALEGRTNKNLRHTYQNGQDEGCAFEVFPVAAVPDLLPELKKVSDSWLAAKNTREKGFSLGVFDETYLKLFPVAVVRVEGNIVAFANVLLGSDHDEISVDLMRQTLEAPPSAMDFLLISLMLWGKNEGYRWFNLGMAPLSGLGDHALTPLWAKAGAFVFRHGENFYNFKGLRRYKEKFRPVWRPRYLASPGGLALPIVVTNLASLISGGIKGVVSK
ncbi:MAG TPA: bifunctional lysylphosphatidylglycerol flippase/synthetase MprF [bacterium]|jgi:phosphatidylglycerol lysyltransferase